MTRIIEIGRIPDLADFRPVWSELLRQTPGASFFQSLDWLEVYWRHFGAGQRLRVLVALDGGRPSGIVPLVVRSERSKVGQVRVLTFPLHDWGTFYGPIGPRGAETLAACLEHIRHTPRDWDILELRWQGAVETDPTEARRAMTAGGFQAYATVWDHTSIVDLAGTWDAYWSGRKGAWLRRLRHDERRLCRTGELSYVRYRPAGSAAGDGSPRWELYDACEALARHSWQGDASDGTTLSHESVRGFSCASCTRPRPPPARRTSTCCSWAVCRWRLSTATTTGVASTGCAADTMPGSRRRGRATYCWPVRCAIVSRGATGCTTWAWARWPASDISSPGGCPSCGTAIFRRWCSAPKCCGCVAGGRRGGFRRPSPSAAPRTGAADRR